MPLNQLLLILRSRIWLMVFVLVATVVAGVLFTVAQDKRYLAASSLLLNFASENPYSEDSAATSPQLANSYIATQVDVIKSRNVVQRVIDALGLAETDLEREEWTTILLTNLDVEAGPESRIITIYYEAYDRVRAADVVNAFAEAYVATTQQLAVRPAQRNAEWFDAQLAGMRDKLEKAQARLTRFQQEKGIVALNEQLDTETARLNDLSEQLLAAQSQMYDVRSRQLGVNHPDYIRASAQLESIRASMNEQKQQVLALKQQRDQLDVLAREVNVERQAYERALQSYYNEQLRSTIGHTRVEVLDHAVPPSEPYSPNLPLNVVGSVLLGLMLAGLFAVGAELTFRRIRTPADIDELLETRVLSSV